MAPPPRPANKTQPHARNKTHPLGAHRHIKPT